MVFINPELSYIATGRELFRSGELVYINKAVEQMEAHLHIHDFIEVAYVASGEGVHIIGNNRYNVSRGDLFVINYNVAHEFRSFPDRQRPNLVIYNCIFRPEFIDYTLINCKGFEEITHHFLFNSLFSHEIKNKKDISLIGHKYFEIEDLYKKMHHEYINRYDGYTEIIRAYVIELLVTVFRLYKRHSSSAPIEDTYRHIIENALKHMKQNYDKDIKLEELSMMSFFSRNYFCRLFKETTGMTAVEYMQKIRIQEACRLLKKTNDTILSISSQVGYRDIKFFRQLFKRYTGQTPGNYRKSGL